VTLPLGGKRRERKRLVRCIHAGMSMRNVEHGVSLFCSDCNGEATMSDEERRELEAVGGRTLAIGRLIDRFKQTTRRSIARKAVDG